MQSETYGEMKDWINVYQDMAAGTAVYPEVGSNYVYPALGLAGETGEVVELVKKALRDDGGEITEARLEALKRELGDVLWYVAALCSELGLELGEVMEKNLVKLKERMERETLKGEGDFR